MEGKSIYQGRSWRLRVNQAKKSAEVIVLVANEVRIETAQVSQTRKDRTQRGFQWLKESQDSFS